MDGQGIAHPRRLGIASHFGVLTDFPTIGCAKSKLFGQYQDPSPEPKSYSFLMDKKEVLGFAYRTKKNTSPIFVSPGHKTDCESALRILNSMEFRYRITEPTRQAHLYANEIRVRESCR
jgi:deoxyribonuclease V